MNEVEVYHILCLDNEVLNIKEIKGRFKGFDNIKLTVTNGLCDYRFIINSTPVDLIIANLDNEKIDVTAYVKNIENSSLISPPVIFFSKLNSWKENHILKGFDCSYFIEHKNFKNKIFDMSKNLLPDLEEEYRALSFAA